MIVKSKLWIKMKTKNIKIKINKGINNQSRSFEEFFHHYFSFFIFYLTIFLILFFRWFKNICFSMKPIDDSWRSPIRVLTFYILLKISFVLLFTSSPNESNSDDFVAISSPSKQSSRSMVSMQDKAERDC